MALVVEKVISYFSLELNCIRHDTFMDMHDDMTIYCMT